MIAQCICGHAEGDHIRSGGCRAPGCLCDRFRPIPEVPPSAIAFSLD